MAMAMTSKCVFCGHPCSNTSCHSCSVSSRIEKFSRLLERFGAASNSVDYANGIIAVAESSWQVVTELTFDHYPSVDLVYRSSSTSFFHTTTIIRRCLSSIRYRCTVVFETG